MRQPIASIFTKDTKDTKGEKHLKITYFPFKMWVEQPRSKTNRISTQDRIPWNPTKSRCQDVKPSEFLQNCGLCIFQEIWPHTEIRLHLIVLLLFYVGVGFGEESFNDLGKKVSTISFKEGWVDIHDMFVGRLSNYIVCGKI